MHSYRLFEADREKEAIMYTSKRPPCVRALTETVHLNTCTQHTLKYTHTPREYAGGQREWGRG